jgi:hypothetical protein
VSRIRPILVLLALAACVPETRADEGVITRATNNAPLPEPSQSGQPSPDREPTFPAGDEPSYHTEADDWKIELSAEHRRILNGDYQYSTGATLSLLYAPTDEDSFGLFGGVGAVQLIPGSAADQIVHEPVYLEGGIVARHYFTPSHVFLRPYITLNAAYFYLSWNYRTPIPLENGNLDGDTADGIEACAGVGLSARLHERLKLFGELTGGGVALLNETEAGFDNPLGSFGYIAAKAGLSFSF